MSMRRRHSRARTAAALMPLSLVVVGVSACGNLITVHDAGRVGITVDSAGHPVIAVMTCAKATPVIEMAEGRKPSDPDTKTNVQRGTWQARQEFAGVEMIALDKPGEIWTMKRNPGTLEADRLFVVDGGTTEDDNASLAGVSFRIPDLAQLTPNQVQVDGKVESISTFGSYRCE